CLEALRNALRRGRPEIFNSDQGSQFTSERFTGELEARGIAISMDGRGRCLDNIFIERLWRSLKYEEVYVKDYGSRRSLGGHRALLSVLQSPALTSEPRLLDSRCHLQWAASYGKGWRIAVSGGRGPQTPAPFPH